MTAPEKIKCKATDTKQEILKKYREHLDEINQKKEGSLDPQQITAEKKKVETLERVEKVAKLDVPQTIVQLQTSISQALSGILSTLDEKRSALADIEEAIRIKNVELNDLYGIEKEAGSLAALIESYRVKEEELTGEHDAKMVELQSQLDEMRKSVERQRAAWVQELADLKKADLTARTRENEQYNYDFERSKKTKLDALADEIAKRTQVAIDRETAVAIREKVMSELEAKVKELEGKIVTESERIRKETEDRCKSSADTAARFAKMSHDNEVARLTSQIEASNARATDLLAQNSKMQQSLDKATEKLQEIASAALKAGADAKTIAELRSFEPSRSSK